MQIVELIKIRRNNNERLDFKKHKDWLQSLSFDNLKKYLKTKGDVEAFVDSVAVHIDCFSKTQILSLGKYVFMQCKEDNKDYINKVAQF